jgi:hypothetical protein
MFGFRFLISRRSRHNCFVRAVRQTWKFTGGDARATINENQKSKIKERRTPG